jgi:elongation factor 1 alpha-like protein
MLIEVLVNIWRTEHFSGSFSFANFFKDAPWLNVPMERRAMFVAPRSPRGGLLGGSSDGAPKISKLQALAAARKKKAQEQRTNESTGVEKPMANLSLDSTSKKAKSVDKPSMESSREQKPTLRGFPMRKRKDSNPHEKAPLPSIERESDSDIVGTPIEDTPLDQAEPSAFANTMFSNTSSTAPHQHPNNFFSLPYAAAAATTILDPFAGPSPDDVVIAAQSKGSTTSVRPEK